MALTIQLPPLLNARRSVRAESPSPIVSDATEQLPESVLIQDIGEQRSVTEAFKYCGRQAIAASTGGEISEFALDREYETLLTDLKNKEAYKKVQGYWEADKVTDARVIHALGLFSVAPVLSENPLVQLDQVVAADLLKSA